MGENAKTGQDPDSFDSGNIDLVVGEELLDYATVGLGIDLWN